MTSAPSVIAVARDDAHRFGKAPCVQIEGLSRGLMKQLGGVVRPGDPIDVVQPGGVHDPLGPV